jgi:hypothetical protein
VLKALAIVYREVAAGKFRGRFTPIRRCLTGARILLFPRMVVQYKLMNLVGKLDHPTRNCDPLYFIAYPYYISRQFTIRQRVDVAMNHHKYELQAYNRDYIEQIYRSEGILLWQRSFDGHHFKIVLTAAAEHRVEGDLTAILSVNNTSLCNMAFCYLNANIFGLKPSMTMLISKNQTDRTSLRNVFDRCFKQSSPQLFCLFAISGIALANGFKTVFAIKHDAQIFYKARFDSGFRNSYTALWEKFDAVEVDGHAYVLNVPLMLRPIELVDPVHRRRARARRRYWEEIVCNARESVVKYRARPCSDPMRRSGARSSGGQVSSDAMLLAVATSSPDGKPGGMLPKS